MEEIVLRQPVIFLSRVPGVGRIAVGAAQVAASKANKGSHIASSLSFSIDGIKNLHNRESLSLHKQPHSLLIPGP